MARTVFCWFIRTGLVVTYPLNSFSSDAYQSDLNRMRPDGSQVEQLTFSTAFDPNQPRYTPDGVWIIYTRVAASRREMWMIPAEGGDPVQVLTEAFTPTERGSPTNQQTNVRQTTIAEIST